MNVLLVSCYELGHQPLGVASPAAHLREAGFPVDCLDLAVERLDESKVRAAEFVGISIPMHTATRLGVAAARSIRELNPAAHICFYGLYAPLNADYLLAQVGDSVIGGEFETPLVERVRHLAGQREAPPPGVRTGDGDTGPHFGRQRFRVPARDLLPSLDRYARFDDGRGGTRLAGYVEASRGCAHRCRHCPIPPVYEGRLRIVQENVVLADIEQLVEMGAGHITFGDPDFLNGVKHSLRIARRMHERHPELGFDFTAKIEHLLEHRDAVSELAELGCAFIVSAVESLNDTILGYLSKGHTAADVDAAVELTRAAGIALRPSFVSFTPWTTLDDFLAVLDFVAAREMIYHVDPVQYAVRLLLPPGSWLLGIPELRPYVGAVEPRNFAYRWEHPDPRMDALQRDVASTVEEAASRSEDPWITFHRVRRKARALAGLDPGPIPDPPVDVERPPGLSEAWFCCAEPTAEQAGLVGKAEAAI